MAVCTNSKLISPRDTDNFTEDDQRNYKDEELRNNADRFNEGKSEKGSHNQDDPSKRPRTQTTQSTNPHHAESPNHKLILTHTQRTNAQ